MTDTEQALDLTNYNTWIRADARSRTILADAVDTLETVRMTGGGAAPANYWVPTATGEIGIEADAVGFVPGWSWVRTLRVRGGVRAVGAGAIDAGADPWSFTAADLAAAIVKLTGTS
jgi:hypothetical protein